MIQNITLDHRQLRRNYSLRIRLKVLKGAMSELKVIQKVSCSKKETKFHYRFRLYSYGMKINWNNFCHLKVINKQEMIKIRMYYGTLAQTGV